MILAIDTSTRWMGIAICSDDAVICEKVWQTQYRHTVELAPAVQSLMHEAGVSADAFTSLAVAIGPGSFTSLRIGLSFAKGFVLPRKIPLIGIPTLDILARMQPPSKNKLLCVLQVGKKNLAAAQYEYQEKQWVCIVEPYLTDAQEIEKMIDKPTMVAGEMSAEERTTIARKWKNALLASPALSVRRPSFLAELGYEQLRNNTYSENVTLAPIYLQTKSIE